MKRTVSNRAARPSDLPQIVKLLQLVSLPIEGVAEHLSDFVLMEEVTAGDVLGCVGLEVYGDSALLRSLAVSPELQGKGYGKKLAATATQHAKKRGVKTLILLTTTAEEFFVRAGFKRLERELVPDSVKQSVEFKSACPVSAVCMMKKL